MKSLKLTDTELLSMKQFYEKELEETLTKLEHVRKVLKKLGAVVPGIDVSVKGKGVTGVTKRGRKSKWGVFIKNALESTKTPMTYEQLVDKAMSDLKLPESKRSNTRQAIISSTYRMRNMHGELRTFAMKGSRIKFVALPDWFATNGKIKSEFSSRVKEIPQPVFQEGKRPGRPRKNPVESKPAAKKATRTRRTATPAAKKATAPKKAGTAAKKTTRKTTTKKRTSRSSNTKN